MLPGDTSLGGRSPDFPSTAWSVIDRLKRGAEPDPQAAIASLLARYWKPVYVCIRVGWRKSNEDAKDLTQEFFLFLLEGEALKLADPQRGRFRSYLKTVLRNFLGMEHRKETRLKRGGAATIVPIGLPDDELPVAAPAADPESVFDREWARSLVAQTLAELETALRAAGRADHWEIFQAHDLAEGAEPPTYADLAARHACSESQIKTILQETRRRLRDGVILKIREYALDEQEVWQELEFLMGQWR
jgi:RNA polymerase sigma-70 factor (ECF subfamily)